MALKGFQNYARLFPTTFKLVSRTSRIVEQRRCSHDVPNSQFGHSVILLQDGLNIEELPIAVRRANDKFLQMRLTTYSEVQYDHSEKDKSESVFKKCQNPEAVMSLLSELNKEEVTAPVAYQALAKLAELGMNIGYRNLGAEIEKSFTMDAVLLQLGSTICKFGATDQLIGSLRLVLLPSFPGRIGKLRVLLAESCLNRVLDNVCSVVQVCQIVELFAAMSQQVWADKCWVSLMGRSMDETEILRVFQILPLLKDSQRAVFNYLERVLILEIGKLDERSLLKILSIVDELKLPQRRICFAVSQWVRLNLHTINEEGLTSLLILFRKLDHSDHHLNRVMERYFKSRTTAVLTQELLIAASDYCHHFRLFSPAVLNVIANGFSRLGEEKLNVRTIEAVLTAFGQLDFHPDDDFNFWSIVEGVLERRLVEFRPEAFLDVLMSCIYLQRHPMNFMPRLFSANFIHRLHSQTREELVEVCRSKIKLLDAAMSFECSQYGPSHVLPKDFHAKSLRNDGRIAKMTSQLTTPLQEICGKQFIVSSSVVLRDLPLNPAYIVDILISPSNEPSLYRYGNSRTHNNRKCLALLIHPPEHFALHSSVKKLIGPQAMRHRHLLLMEFRPVHLDLEELVKLSTKNQNLHLFLDSLISPLLNDLSRL